MVNIYGPFDHGRFDHVWWSIPKPETRMVVNTLRAFHWNICHSNICHSNICHSNICHSKICHSSGDVPSDCEFGAMIQGLGYLRLIDSCITQLKAQGPSRTCTESKEEEEEVWGVALGTESGLRNGDSA